MLACAGDDFWMVANSEVVKVDSDDYIRTLTKLNQIVKFFKTTEGLAMLSLFSALSPEGIHTPIKEGLRKFLLLTSYSGTNRTYLQQPYLYHLANYIQVKDMGASKILERLMAIMLYRSLLDEGEGRLEKHAL